jgi:putative endonuclease
MANQSPSNYPDIGTLGEDLVTNWLEQYGWKIRHRRWHCRWGEIDIIAESGATLAFIEVKTRSQGNWDAGGRDAITSRKQQKLWRTAQMYLAQYPEVADCDCRFDVAIVFQESISQDKMISKNSNILSAFSDLEQRLRLQEYIVGAFDLSQ